MQLSALINKKYTKAPGVTTLPRPRPKGPTGVTCSDCPPASGATMNYVNETEDGYLVKCSREQHYKTWKCHRLNYELGLLNGGHSIPVDPYEESVCGPRVSPRGEILPEKQSNKPKKIIDSIPCARHGTVLASQGHKARSNKNCPNGLCSSCCVEAKLLPCAHQTRAASHATLQNLIGTTASSSKSLSSSSKPKASTSSTAPRPSSSAPTFTPAKVTSAPSAGLTTAAASTSSARTYPLIITSTATPSNTCGNGTVTRGLPLDSAQGSHKVGTPLSQEGFNAIDASMRARGGVGLSLSLSASNLPTPSAGATVSTAMDVTSLLMKLVTAHIWTCEARPPARSFLAQNWPVVSLDEITGVREEAEAHFPPGKWNELMCVYDESAQNWCELKIQYPHLYPHGNRVIIARLKTLKPEDCQGLAAMIGLNVNGETTPLPSTSNRHIDSDDSDIEYISGGRKEKFKGSMKTEPPSTPSAHAGEPSLAEIFDEEMQMTFEDLWPPSESDDPVSDNEGVQSPSSLPDDIFGDNLELGTQNEPVSALSESGEEGISDEEEVLTNVNPLSIWPQPDTKIQDLLTWYQMASLTTCKAAWDQVFGSKFTFKKSTVYRYFKMVTKLEKSGSRLSTWAAHTADPSVAQARAHFPDEFTDSAYLAKVQAKRKAKREAKGKWNANKRQCMM